MISMPTTSRFAARSSSALAARLGTWALASAVLLLSACGSTVKLNDKVAPVEQAASMPSSSSSGSSSTSVANVQAGSATKDAGFETLAKAIYFDYDSDVVKPEFQSTVEAYAKRLTSDPRLHLRLEGNTDERGGSEYNLALGQKRADAVAKALTLLGAQSSQIEAVSLGKENPAATGHDEEAWAKNRRVEFK